MTDPTTPPQGDRRIYPRSPLVLREARYIAGMEVFFGYATNVSRSGLFVGTAKMRPMGSQVEIRFRLPDSDRDIHCMAEVVWCRPFRKDSPHAPGFGLRFLDISEEDADAVEAWVDAQPDKS